MSQLFQTPAIVESVSTRADKSIKVVLSTQELIPEQASQLIAFHQKQGWFLFKENEVVSEDIPDEPAPEFKTDKTPSQRLRSHLYKYWELNTNKAKPFDTFYNEWVAKKCEEIKELLPKEI